MNLWQLNRRPKDDNPSKGTILFKIAADIAISITPFEDKDRTRIMELALQIAEKNNNIRDLYRMVEDEMAESLSHDADIINAAPIQGDKNGK